MLKTGSHAQGRRDQLRISLRRHPPPPARRRQTCLASLTRRRAASAPMRWAGSRDSTWRSVSQHTPPSLTLRTCRAPAAARPRESTARGARRAGAAAAGRVVGGGTSRPSLIEHMLSSEPSSGKLQDSCKLQDPVAPRQRHGPALRPGAPTPGTRLALTRLRAAATGGGRWRGSGARRSARARRAE